MTAKRLSLPILAAILCGAFALWVSFGALAITDALGASRIGVLPSPWWLVAALTIAAAAAVAAGRRAMVLWLSVIVLLPWLPPPLPPAALIWAGPRPWWVGCAVVIGLVIPWSSLRVMAALRDPQRASTIAAALAACTYLLAAWQIFPQLPDGDEPHYLVIAQSLLKDGDLQIANNYQ